VLFVGTKKQAQESIELEARRSGMPYVNHRWMGGMLTNFTVMRRQIERLNALRAIRNNGGFTGSKKQVTQLEEEMQRLERFFGGMADMKKLPGAVYVVDPRKEHIAVTEARKLAIPIVAITDSNCDPDEIDKVIPGNDDAIRAVKLITSKIAESWPPRRSRRRRAPASTGSRQKRKRRARKASPGCPTSMRRNSMKTKPWMTRNDMAITADQVKMLREATGAGMMDAKRALEATGGDFEKAKDWLRQKGMAKAGAKATRAARQGIVETYVHHNQQLGVLVEVNSESDFVARNEQFRELAHEIAVHIAAADPRYLRREDVPADVLERERAIFQAQARDQKKPEAVMEKIVQGKLNDFYKREVLLDQPWTKDDKRSVSEVVKEAIGKIGENITISRFARFKVGEGPSPSST
ncbi:MAG: 30S ribosomal protein S2, partial [Chloroflexi bacterium]